MLKLPSKRFIRQSFFNKIIFIYSTIAIASLIILAIFISFNVTQTLKIKELSTNKQILESVSTYFDSQYFSSQRILQHFYEDKKLYNDIIYFLKNDYKKYIQYELNEYSKSNTFEPKNIYTYINSCFVQQSDIKRIILYSNIKKFFFLCSSASQKNQASYYLYTSDISNLVDKVKKNNNNKTPCIITNFDIVPDNIYTEGNTYSIIYNVKDTLTLKNVGNIIIDYDVNGIYESCLKHQKDLKGYVLIIRPDGMVIFDSSNKYYGKKYPYFHLLKNSNKPLMLEEKSFVNINTTSHSGVIVIGVIPEKLIDKSYLIIKRTSFFICLICIITTLLLNNFSTSFFSKRIKNIMSALKKLQQGDLSARIPLDKKNDELTQIACSFNNMCKDLNNYIDKVYVSEIKQKNAELIALQTQINPHFLYNTLETIRMKAISKNVPEIADMIYILAALFRNSVKNKMITTISSEIEYCKLYLKLFQNKYDGRLSYNINIKTEILNYGIISLTLQPIIENYIVHGIKLNSQDNNISIKGYKKYSDINIIIKDNGKGIENKQLDILQKTIKNPELYPSSKMGLANVNKRLSIIFGNEYGIKINSKKDFGTCVLIKFPALKKEELNTYVQCNVSR